MKIPEPNYNLRRTLIGNLACEDGSGHTWMTRALPHEPNEIDDPIRHPEQQKWYHAKGICKECKR